MFGDAHNGCGGGSVACAIAKMLRGNCGFLAQTNKGDVGVCGNGSDAADESCYPFNTL